MGDGLLTSHAPDPIVLKQLLGAVACAWILVQAVGQEVLDELPLLVVLEPGVVRLLRLNRNLGLLLILPPEWELGAQHDVRKDAQGPRVNLVIVGRSLADDLWRHVHQRAERLRALVILLEHAREAKVRQLANQLGLPALVHLDVHHYVFQLQVAMHHILLVHVVEGP